MVGSRKITRAALTHNVSTVNHNILHLQTTDTAYWLSCTGVQLKRITIHDYRSLAQKLKYKYLGNVRANLAPDPDSIPVTAYRAEAAWEIFGAKSDEEPLFASYFNMLARLQRR